MNGLGRKRFYEGIRAFGFGKRASIRLPGEENGILHPLKKWSGVSLAFHSHGYELNVTPLQMVRAFNVLASGGYLLQPMVLKKINGVHLKPPKRGKNPVWRYNTSNGLYYDRCGCQRHRKKNPASKGLGWQVKPAPPRRFCVIRTHAKNMCRPSVVFFRRRNPRITMFVVVDEPKGLFYGGDVAAPLFKSIAERLLIYLKIFPELDSTSEMRL